MVYVNAAFAQMCGYPAAALLGTNLRMLQGTDRDQEARTRLAEAVKPRRAGARAAAQLPPRRLAVLERDGGAAGAHRGQAHALRRLSPRCQRAAEERRARAATGLPSWLREDRLTGLHSRAYFEELLQRDWQLAQRDSHEIGLTLFDIDDLGAYNEKFDRAAGDACIRRVARVIATSYRRGGDLVGRWQGGTFVVLTQGEAAEKAAQYAHVVKQRVRDLLMHHPTAGAGRYVTLSAGIASLVPPRTLEVQGLLKACSAACAARRRTARTASPPPRRRLPLIRCPRAARCCGPRGAPALDCY